MKKRVVYVPLDDRPANLDDVILQGRAAGIEVIVPQPEVTANRLDSELTAEGSEVISTSAPTFGQIEPLQAFLAEHAACADGFILSIDMLAYGGLIGSRRLRDNGGGAYPNYDAATMSLLHTIRGIKEHDKAKPVYVLDTVMRLASTVQVEGLTLQAYQESRSLMQQPRQQQSEFEAILSGYDRKPDGSSFGAAVHFDKEQYYNARRHKLKTTRYVLEELVEPGYVDFIAIGVDDAYIHGIQANEIAWIERYIDDRLGGQNGRHPGRAVILPDADGLGHSLLARIARQLYGDGSYPQYLVSYYGPHGSAIVNPYEYQSVHDNMVSHIDIAGGGLSDGDSYELEVVAVTAASEAAAATARVAANGASGIPTILIDFTSGGASGHETTNSLLSHAATGRMFGYSGWNTAGNKIGLALGMAHSRYAFVTAEAEQAVRADAADAHASLLFKRLLKDYGYKKVVIGEIRAEAAARTPYTNVTADQNLRLFVRPSDYEQLSVLLEQRMQAQAAAMASQAAFNRSSDNGGGIVWCIAPAGWELADYTSFELPAGAAFFSWGRAFEITLKPMVHVTALDAEP
ncbi:DUF4127 family protein [Paenibacillus sp. SYP-B4298]|uniref:DUF4127 family protein n=1 Tax=Paenibacillus sp. SYP-B4298 TaxID=2996034 RepID=UPI0022DD2D3C|nr:DUF4127 family protein [Paenibacillus sp. SYP-B4298]